MSEIQLILELIKAQTARLDALQTNFQVLNDHSIEWVEGMARVATQVEILMWFTGAILLAFIGIVAERIITSALAKKNGNGQKK